MLIRIARALCRTGSGASAPLPAGGLPEEQLRPAIGERLDLLRGEVVCAWDARWRVERARDLRVRGTEALVDQSLALRRHDVVREQLRRGRMRRLLQDHADVCGVPVLSLVRQLVLDRRALVLQLERRAARRLRRADDLAGRDGLGGR